MIKQTGQAWLGFIHTFNSELRTGWCLAALGLVLGGVGSGKEGGPPPHSGSHLNNIPLVGSCVPPWCFFTSQLLGIPSGN